MAAAGARDGALQRLTEGDALYVEDEFARAKACYDAALEADPSVVDDVSLAARVFGHRSAVQLELHNFEDALDDANKALRAQPGDYHAQYRKGLACFYLEEYETAKEAFSKASALLRGRETSLGPVVAQWLRKVDAELEEESSESDEEEDDVQVEVEAAHSSAPDTAPASHGKTDSDGAQAPSSSAAASADSSPAGGAAGSSGATQAQAAKGPEKQPLAFYQTTTHVTIPVMQKGISKEDSSVEFTERTVSASLQLPSGSEYVLEVDLFDKIKPGESKVFYRPTKVEIKLAKAVPDVQWPALEREAAVAPPPAVATTAKPPSAYAGKKDWESVERELKAEEEAEEPEGEEALNKLFRQIYAKADEKTRMAMNKSFQTSGGTVLSTNWGEVEKTDYEKERKAPEGMEWRKWG